MNDATSSTNSLAAPWVERPGLEFDLSIRMARRFQNIPSDAIAKGKRLLAAVMAEMPKSARMLAYMVRLRTANRFHREISTLASVFDVDWRDVLLANISYDLVLSTFGCSTIALPGPNGPLLARNMDWWPEDILAQASYLIRCGARGKLAFAQAGWPGSVGVVTGMSGRGFAVALNAVISPEGTERTGYPVLLHLRRVIEDAADFDAALGMLARQRLATSALFTLVGVQNQQRVVVERTPRRCALRWPRGDEPLICTNDFRALFPPETHGGLEIYETTCHRYDSLCVAFADHTPRREVSDDALLYFLSDPDVIQGITAQHVIARPRQQKMRLFVPQRLVA